jgi:hypothetical protein
MSGRRVLAVAVAAAGAVVPVALPATVHPFTATYNGYGRGEVHGTTTSGSGVLTGRAKVIGPSTLTGSVSGAFVSRTCVDFGGTGVLKGKAGSLRLSAHGATACAAGNPDTVGFSGRAVVVGGTGEFKGAHGTLRFAGTYLRQSESVTISFSGGVSY